MTMAESVRRIVIRIINPRLFNRYQILAWYTDHLFTNCKIEDFDNEDFQVLDLLTYDEHEQSNDIDDSKFSEYRLITRINKKDPYAAIHSRHRLQNNRTENERLFQLTLKTEILTVMDKIKVAILVDSNFSMKTGDFRIHAAVAYETICKTIKGLKRPFQFTNSVTGQSIVLTPKVLVSVVAENQESDLIPLRSYLHNQEITEENTMSVFESLYLEMIEHETDLINLQGRYDSNLLVNSTLDAEQIDNIIDYGLYSLNMMSPDFCPILLYLTDGVSSTFGENIGRKTCQTCIREFVQFAVIQVGFGKGFTPTSSLGFVPNQIELRFLAAALNGTFVYADDCPYIEEDTADLSPNLYHNVFAFRMTSLFYTQLNEEKYRTPNFGSRSVDVIRSNFIITDTTESKAVAYEELAFPWRVDSKSPIVSEILCSYRQYQLVGIPIGRIFQSRINDGFVLKRMKQLQGKSQTKLEIIFSLAFGPHIEILYTLKFSILAHQQPTRLHDFVPEKVIRVDINILAHHAFALLFINIHSYDIGNTQKGFNSIIYESLIQLNSLLKDVIECDEALSVLGQFNTQSALILSQQLGDSGTPLGRRNTSDLPTNYWHYVMEVIKLKPHLLDTFDMNLILRSASLEDDPGQTALEYFKRDDKNFNSRYQKATIYLSGFLKRWASFALSKTCYVRWVLRDGDFPTGCVFLTLFYETTNLMRIKLRFFSVELTEKREILKSFKEGLILKIESKSGELIYPIYSCEKLCRNLLVSYSANEESRMTEWWKKQDPTPFFFIPHPRLSRSFLKQKSWIWFADFEVSDDLIWDNFFDDAFMALYNARIEEGMMRIFESPGTVTFYKEDNTLLPPYTVSIQCVILWNVKGRFLSSQLWMEPYFRKSASAGNQEFNAYVAKELQKDLRNLNRLVAVTFAGIRSLISLRNLEKFSETSIDPPEFVPTEFKLSSICVGSSISLFPLPTFAQKISLPSFRSNDLSEVLELDAQNKMLLDANLTLTYQLPSLSQVTEFNTCQECPELSKIGSLELGFYRNSLKQVFNESNQLMEVSMDATLASIIQRVIGVSSGVYKKADIFFQNSASHILAIILPAVFINGACPLLLIESPKRPDNASCVKFTELNAFSVELTLSRDNLWDQAIDVDSSFVRHDVLVTLRKEFLRSAFKSLYTALLANIEYPPECMQQVFEFLVPRRLNIGITDFVNIAQIWKSRNPTDMKILNLSKIQADLANVIQSRFSAYGDETTLYYIQQTSRTIPNSELFSLDLTNDPLFIRITVVSEDSKILSHYPSLLENITDAGNSFESFVPSLNTSVHVSIDHFVVSKKLSIRNAEIIERLNRDLTNIFDASIMKAMLHLNELEVNDMLADYWNDLLSSASKSVQPRFELDYMYNEFSDIGENDYFFTYTTNFIHQSCSDLFEKAVFNVDLAGRSFSFNGNCFYICSRYCDFYSAPFWVSITVPNSQLLNLYLFTVELTMDDKLRLLSELHAVIKAAVWETNQRYLLRELAKTNMSLDADFLATKAPKDSPILDDVLFHFGCPLKYEAFFNVHWRLTPTKVLNSVLSMFQPLLIHNRANYIVHSEKFYLRFQIVGADVGNESDYSSRGIKMQCFGVDDVGDEIKQSLVRVIRSKIDLLLQSEITLFLSRNVSVAKLSAQDMEFLIPPHEVPSSEVTYLLVKELENMHLFMLLLRQEFLLFLKPVLADPAGLALLGNYYQKRYGVMHNVSEKTKGGGIEFSVGDLTFVYSVTKNSHTTDLDACVGPGLMGICISPLDRENKTIFYTSAPQYLAKNFEVNLENEYQIKAAQSLEESTSWNGYKVDVSIWTKGNPNLVILQKRILEAFQNTLVGYTIESYYRSSDFKTLLGLSTYVNENTAQTANSQPVPYKIANAVQKLPQILRAGAERMNPVIQYVSVATDLGIPLIVHGVNNTILAKDEQACFFRVIGESVYIIESEDGQENECDCHIMIGSTDQITSSTNDKSSLTATESSPRVIQSEPEIDRNISTVRSINELKSISSLRSNHDLMMFPGDFFPSFAPYQRRSSFFTITVFNDTLSVATYKSNILTSWKRVEAEKLFLKIIKMLMMAKLRQQFNLKLDLVYSKLNNAKEEGHLFHQTLDLIGQISGLISEEIQQQILDYLQSIFVARVAGAQIESNRQLIIDMTELSVQEMAEILQSLVLCQNISTPIVFSNCCHSKNPAFSNLHLHNLDRSQLLGAIQKLTELPATPSAPQSMHRQVWYKKMLDAFLDSFTIYLESNGMKREPNIKVMNENSGHFVMSDQEFFSVPPIFFQKDGRKRFLIIQCGFKSFFAYINIMMLKKKTGTSNCAEISEEDYLRIARKTNIIAFSFDFHLRYLQDSVFSPDLPFNILMVLRNFSDLHPIRPSTARNRIIHGTYIDPEQRSMEKIINYIANNCKDYGFNPINSGLDLLGFGVTTNTLSKKKTKTNSRLEFTLICTINVQWEGVTSFEEKVEYFIIVVDYENRFPSPESKENVSEIKSYVSDPLREYIGEGYYIGDVVKYFDKKIRYSIQEASCNFERDTIWEEMRGNSKIAHKWDMLENIAASYTDALKLDPQLRQLLTNNLPWNDIFILLRNSDPFHIKYIEKGSKRANPILLVFDDVNQDQVIRMEIEPGGSPLFVSMYSAFRVKQDYTREMHFVKSVTDRILLTLWELCEIVSK